MYISRKIDHSLLNWKNAKHRKPLILRGVRQCGKTAAVRHFGESFSTYIEVNLEKEPRFHKLFDGDINISDVLARLELESGKDIKDGKTLLFLDEIQECPRAITALRYFYEERPELHVIAAGSLLEFTLSHQKRQRIQFPVGRVRSLYMYPFSFCEYLAAVGQTKLKKMLDNHEDLKQRNIAHELFLKHFKDFLVVGGMPEAVSSFAQTGSFLECQRVHRDIVMNFQEDFDKYDSHVPAENIRLVFEYSMHHAGNQVRSSSAVEGLKAAAFDIALDLLSRAGLVYPVSASSCDTLPLGSGEKNKNIKPIPFDTGIFLTELGLDAGEILGAESFEVLNKGRLAEIFVGLEFLKAADPYQEPHLYYWYRSGANAEVDYVRQVGTDIIPIEVKAAVKGGMKSIRSFLNIHKSPYGLRLSLENFTQYDTIQVVPLYAACTL